MFAGPGAARLNRLRKKSERQVPRGLKSARNIKNKGLIGTLRLRSGRASKSCLIQGCSETSFSASCKAVPFQIAFMRLPLVFCSALPVDEVAEPPGVLVQLDLQLAVLVDGELGGRIQDACAFALVLVVQLEFSSRQVEGLGLAVGVCFAEGDLAVSDEANCAPGRRGDHADEAYVITQRAGNGDAANRRHL